MALLWRARDADDAIRIANDSPRDPGEQRRFTDEIESGMVYVNAITASTPEAPFGGVKDSGYGRELADFGPRSFCNAKTVWVARGSAGSESVE